MPDRASRRPTARSTAVAGLLLGVALTAGGGCVERELVAESEPAGALVRMNDQEMGRTPAGRGFQWYGTYDVVVQAEGYETLRARTPVIAPLWQWPPFDLVAELLPVTFRDVHVVRYELVPTSDETLDPQQVVARARDLRDRLESGQLTTIKAPTTRPAKARPASTRSATRPATQGAGGK